MFKMHRLYKESEIWQTGNKFRIGFIDIGLENNAVAATRVTELPSRRDKIGVQKRRCM